MSLVTVEDYETLTGTDVPAGPATDRMQALLDAASAAVQGATGQTLEKARSAPELVVLEHPRQTLVLSEVPIIEGPDPDTLEVVSPDGEIVPRDHYTAIAKSGELKHCDCHAWGAGCYEVTYSHGYDPVPSDLVALVVGAVDSVAGSGRIASQSVGSYSVTFQDTANVGDVGGLGGSAVDRYRVPAPPMP